MDKQLEEIKNRLDIVISLMIPPFDETRYDIRGETQLAVLKLCELNHTQEEMAKKLGKTKKSIERSIQKLSKQSLIKSFKKNNRTVYLRLK